MSQSKFEDWQGKKIEDWMSVYEVSYPFLTYEPELKEFITVNRIEIAISDEGSFDDLIEEFGIEKAEIRVYPAKIWKGDGN